MFLLPEGGIARHRDRSSSLLLFSAALPAIECSFCPICKYPLCANPVPFFEFLHESFVIDFQSIYTVNASGF